MNKTKLILSVFVIIIVALGVLYGIRVSVEAPSTPEITIETIENKITSTDVLYISEMGDEARVSYNSNNTATVTIIGSEYKDILLEQAISGSGAKYENLEQNIELWEKGEGVVIYKGDEKLFLGKKFEVLTEEGTIKMLSESVWIWNSTEIGHPSQPDKIITPNKSDAFTIKFNTDKTLTGTTDCNNFSGTYSFDSMGQVDIGPLMATLMYCEGSQEQEFLESIKDGKITYYGDSFQLSNYSSGRTVYFTKASE
jgi:heat shock protein HslJ/membrane-bound inhibitor of C-type lysozyme